MVTPSWSNQIQQNVSQNTTTQFLDAKWWENLNQQQTIAIAVGAAVAVGAGYYWLSSANSDSKQIKQEADYVQLRTQYNLDRESPEKKESRKRKLQFQQDQQSAVSGTKEIYFDQNDNMYTQDEIKNIKPNAKLTKMVVRVPEQERKRFLEEQERRKTRGLEDFMQKIQSSKSEYHGYHQRRQFDSRTQRAATNAKQFFNKNNSSALSSTSSGANSQVIPNLQPRHFKNKESLIWLNMLETISNNQILNKQQLSSSGKARTSSVNDGRNSNGFTQAVKMPQKNLDMSQINEELEQDRNQAAPKIERRGSFHSQ